MVRCQSLHYLNETNSWHNGSVGHFGFQFEPFSSLCWTSDPAMKQFLLHLDETMALGKKFILKDLDDTHLFIMAEVVQTLQERVGELMDQNSFPITQK